MSQNEFCDLEKRALVLSGGGVLGAYEAGVMLYTSELMVREGLESSWPNIFTGTSVGALNASFLAANSHDFSQATRNLVAFWKSINLSKILSFEAKDLASLLKLGTGQGLTEEKSDPASLEQTSSPHQPVAGFFDTSPLYEQMKNTVPWENLQTNLRQGTVRGIAFCATEVCTGISVIFYQISEKAEYRMGQDPSKIAKRVTIGVEHAMASAAIPIFFPAVQIGGTCYIDGSLRQNTPLNPALRMGADKVLVISIGQNPKEAATIARKGCRRNPYPGIPFMLGKTINAVLTESLDYELNRVKLYNLLITKGQEIYGNGFLENLNQIMGSVRNSTYRPIATCHIRPSQNLELLAQESLSNAPKELSSLGLSGRIIRRVLTSSAIAESALFSLLMFTPTYIHTLLELGYSDAQTAENALLEFFTSKP